MSSLRSTFLLEILSTAILASPGKRDLCQPGRQTIAGHEYTISCGIDRPGGDYGLLQTNIFGCVTACAADANCETAQYLEGNGHCYFKNTVNSLFTQAGVLTIDKGSACKADTTLTLNGLQCTITCGEDRPGWDYNSIQTGNYLDCASACAADSNCITAQYKETNGVCYLKSRLSQAFESSENDSIKCERPVTQANTTSMIPEPVSTTSVMPEVNSMTTSAAPTPTEP